MMSRAGLVRSRAGCTSQGCRRDVVHWMADQLESSEALKNVKICIL